MILTGWRGGRQVRLRRMERAVNHKRPPSDGESDPCLGACGLPEQAFVVRFAWNLAGMTYATRPSFWRMRRTVKHFRAVATVDRVKHTAFQASVQEAVGPSASGVYMVRPVRACTKDGHL